MESTALQIFVLQDGQLVRSEVFGDGVFTIGREETCDLVLEDESISRRHAVLEFTGGRASLSDLGSSQGTVVNGVPILRSAVTSADEIHVGPYLLKLRQLRRKSTDNAPASGLAGPAARTNVVPIGAAPPSAGARVSSPLMPTPRPGGMGKVLARALSNGGAAVAMTPAEPLVQEADVDALLAHLDGGALNAPIAPGDADPRQLPVVEATLRDASYLADAGLVPAPVTLTPGPVAEITLHPIVDPTPDLPIVEATPDSVAPPTAPAATKPQPSRPTFQPSVARAPEREPIAPATARPSPASAAAPTAPPADHLQVTVFWGRHKVAVRSFAPDGDISAGDDERAMLPLYGFPTGRGGVLASSSERGWIVRAPRGARAFLRDASGSSRPMDVGTGADVPVPSGGAVLLSAGQVHVEFVRERPAPLPAPPPRSRDWTFPALLLAALVAAAIVVPRLPDPPKTLSKADIQNVTNYVRALEQRARPHHRKRVAETKAPERKPPPKPVAQAETLKAATDSLKAVDRVASATKKIDNLIQSLNKITSVTRRGRGRHDALAGLGLPSIPSLGHLSPGTGGGIGDLNGMGGPVTEGRSALRGVAGLSSGTAGSGRVRGIPISVPRHPKHVQGDIDRDALARVINAHVGEMRDCYENALFRNPNLGAGKVTLEWTIGDSGAVIDVSTKTSTLRDSHVVSCLLGVIRGMQFPKPRGGVVIVSYPILFNSVGY